tara:strand:+ start:1633 stop:2697 length:1065 start_codon:yes stop_codon:yes gene_type:complete
MSKAVKTIVTIAAVIAMPYAAPALAGSIGLSGGIATALGGSALAGTVGSVVGSALTGSVLGGLTSKAMGGSYATGRDMGMVSGGLGGLSQTSVTGKSFVDPMSLETVAGPSMPTLTGNYVDATSAAINSATGTTAGAAGTGTGLTSVLTNLTSPDTLMRITTLALAEDPDVTGLSPEEVQLVEQRKTELAEMATTNKALFDQQVAMANEFLQKAAQAQGNPEAAFAETAIQTERQISENTRGMSRDEAGSVARQAKIQGSAAGAAAAAAETERGQAAGLRYTQAALGYLPTEAPQGYAGLALPLMQDLAERRRQAQSDLVYGTTSALGYGEEKDPFLKTYNTASAGIGNSGSIG